MGTGLNHTFIFIVYHYNNITNNFGFVFFGMACKSDGRAFLGLCQRVAFVRTAYVHVLKVFTWILYTYILLI